MNKLERRFCPLNEARVNSEGGKQILRGYAAVFNSLSTDLGGFKEIIRPNAFRTALDSSDPRCLFNHKASLILGRKSSSTLRLKEDGRGLSFECEMPGTSYSKDLQVSMTRGDVRECSFGFSVRDGGDLWEKQSDGTWLRTILEDGIEELYDVSPVVFPAYPDTACAMASLEKNRAAFIPPFNDSYFRKLRLELEAAY